MAYVERAVSEAVSAFVRKNSMLQETLLRLKCLDTTSPFLICNEQHRFLAAEQLRQIELFSNNTILEPIGRNTAPAVALAALSAIDSSDEDPLLLVLAADHVIENVESFHKAVNDAVSYAQNGYFVTFGMVAKVPETGYGYIQRGDSGNNNMAYKVKRFVEKPDYITAQKYIESGEYYWNSGIFLLKAKTYLRELEKYRPDILNVCQAAISTVKHDSFQDFIRIDADTFSCCPDESIDYAVMENTEDSGMIPWLLVAELLCVKNMNLNQLVDERMIAYPASGEINSSLSDPNKSISKVLDKFQSTALNIDHTDAISVEFNEWRFNLRSSNTEPVVRLNVESKNDELLMKNKTDEILNILRS